MPQLKIYSTTTCVFCRAERQFLDDKQFPYKEVMVDEDAQELDEMVKLSGMNAVPFNLVTDDAGKTIDQFVGFDQPRLVKALGIAA